MEMTRTVRSHPVLVYVPVWAAAYLIVRSVWGG